MKMFVFNTEARVPDDNEMRQIPADSPLHPNHNHIGKY